MIRYIANRIGMGVFTLFVLATITFFLVRIIPGGPFDAEVALPPAVLENLEEKYGTNKPMWEQYIIHMKRLLHGDLGDSFKYEGMTVNELIGRGMAATMKLGLTAVVIATVVGVLLGIVSSLRHRGVVDMACMTVSVVGLCMPSFVVAIFLMYIFGLQLDWLPIVGLDTPQHVILPACALALSPIANISRLTRSSMLEALGQDYIMAARSKGVKRYRVITVHALRNALLPVITYMGPMVAYLLTGSFVVENMFAIPGIGRTFVTSITNRDYSTVLGMTIFFGTLVIVCGIIVDILYVIIDPRVKYE